jgi:hypothetical protein
VQGKRIGERMERIKEGEGRPREQGQKGWRIDLSSREKDRQECEEEKKQQGERKEGKRGNDTHQLGACSNSSVRRISPVSSCPPHPPHYKHQNINKPSPP